MDLLFGRRKTPEELLRQNQRALNRAMRELDRERQKLETQEKKIIADIKKMAKQGQMVSSVGGQGQGGRVGLGPSLEVTAEANLEEEGETVGCRQQMSEE